LTQPEGEQHQIGAPNQARRHRGTLLGVEEEQLCAAAIRNPAQLRRRAGPATDAEDRTEG
jgi:hypothetical protein